MLYDLSVSERIDIPAGVGGVVNTSTRVAIPENAIGVLSLRKSVGSKMIFLTSQLLPSGFVGYPELHVANLGGNTAEFRKDQAIATLAVVTKYQSNTGK